MASRLPVKITFGGQEFEIRLTLPVLQDLERVYIDVADNKFGTNLEVSVAFLSAALKHQYPDAVAGLAEMETSVPEIMAAIKAIRDAAGFVPSGEAKAA